MADVVEKLDEIEMTVMDELKDFQRATVERIDYLLIISLEMVRTVFLFLMRSDLEKHWLPVEQLPNLPNLEEKKGTIW